MKIFSKKNYAIFPKEESPKKQSVCTHHWMKIRKYRRSDWIWLILLWERLRLLRLHLAAFVIAFGYAIEFDALHSVGVASVVREVDIARSVASKPYFQG